MLEAMTATHTRNRPFVTGHRAEHLHRIHKRAMSCMFIKLNSLNLSDMPCLHASVGIMNGTDRESERYINALCYRSGIKLKLNSFNGICNVFLRVKSNTDSDQRESMS